MSHKRVRPFRGRSSVFLYKILKASGTEHHGTEGALPAAREEDTQVRHNAVVQATSERPAFSCLTSTQAFSTLKSAT